MKYTNEYEMPGDNIDAIADLAAEIEILLQKLSLNKDYIVRLEIEEIGAEEFSEYFYEETV